MSRPPFTVTPQIDAHIASEVSQALAAQEIEHQRELRQAKRETANAMARARAADHARDTAVAKARTDLEQIHDLATPTPRDWLGRAARRRLHQIHDLLNGHTS